MRVIFIYFFNQEKDISKNSKLLFVLSKNALILLIKKKRIFFYLVSHMNFVFIIKISIICFTHHFFFPRRKIFPMFSQKELKRSSFPNSFKVINTENDLNRTESG